MGFLSDPKRNLLKLISLKDLANARSFFYAAPLKFRHGYALNQCQQAVI